MPSWSNRHLRFVLRKVSSWRELTFELEPASHMPLAQICLTSPEYLLASGTNLGLIVPLSMACFAILIVVPLAAARSRLHIPGYVGLAFLASIVGLLCGRISGIHGVAGTPWGVLAVAPVLSADRFRGRLGVGAFLLSRSPGKLSLSIDRRSTHCEAARTADHGKALQSNGAGTKEKGGQRICPPLVCSGSSPGMNQIVSCPSWKLSLRVVRLPSECSHSR